MEFEFTSDALMLEALFVIGLEMANPVSGASVVCAAKRFASGPAGPIAGTGPAAVDPACVALSAAGVSELIEWLTFESVDLGVAADFAFANSVSTAGLTFGEDCRIAIEAGLVAKAAMKANGGEVSKAGSGGRTRFGFPVGVVRIGESARIGGAGVNGVVVSAELSVAAGAPELREVESTVWVLEVCIEASGKTFAELDVPWLVFDECSVSFRPVVLSSPGRLLPDAVRFFAA